MIDALTTMSGIGGLIAFVAFCVFIPFCLSGDDGQENEFGAMAWLIVGMAAIVFGFGYVPPVTVLLIATPAYFAIGFLWFIWKWRQLILRKRAEARAKWAGVNQANVTGTFEDYAKAYRPAASSHKERIAAWILLWPWSMAWTVLKWPWRLAVKLAEWARGLADRMVERLWKD